MEEDLVVKEVLELKDCIAELNILNISASAYIHVPTEVYNILEQCGQFERCNKGNPSLRYSDKVVIFNSDLPSVKEAKEDEG